jgi:hypothetical protein
MMKNPIFVIPFRYPPSYHDFYLLIQHSGLAYCMEKDIDFGNKNNCYIVNHFIPITISKNRLATVVYWFLERPSSCGKETFPNFIKNSIAANGIDEIWMSDITMFNLVKHSQCRFVPIGSEEGLGTPSDVKTYDLIHLCYIENGSRREILRTLNCKIPIGWMYGNEREESVKQSKFMLSMHQDDDLYFEPLRFAVATAYGIPLISEMCYDAFPYVADEDYVPTDYVNITKSVYNLLATDYNTWKDFGLRMRDKILKQYRFADNIKRAMEKMK